MSDISNNVFNELYTNTIILTTPIDAPLKIHSYSFFLNNIVPHKSVSYNIHIYNRLGDHLFSIDGQINGQEYQNWGTDDTYIENLLVQKIHDYISNNSN